MGFIDSFCWKVLDGKNIHAFFLNYSKQTIFWTLNIEKFLFFSISDFDDEQS